MISDTINKSNSQLEYLKKKRSRMIKIKTRCSIFYTGDTVNLKRPSWAHISHLLRRTFPFLNNFQATDGYVCSLRYFLSFLIYRVCKLEKLKVTPKKKILHSIVKRSMLTLGKKQLTKKTISYYKCRSLNIN